MEGDEQTMFLDVILMQGRRYIFETKHMMDGTDDTFIHVVQSIIKEYVEVGVSKNVVEDDPDSDLEDDAIKPKVRGMMSRIKSVKCNKRKPELLKFLGKSNVIFHNLDSRQTPLFRNGMVIELSPLERKKPPAKRRRKLPSSFDRMAGQSEPTEVSLLEPLDVQTDNAKDPDVWVKLCNESESTTQSCNDANDNDPADTQHPASTDRPIFIPVGADNAFKQFYLNRDECVKCTDGCKDIGRRKEFTHAESKEVFGPRGILRKNCAIYNKNQALFGKSLNASMRRLGVEDLQDFKCHAKNCPVHIKVARYDSGILLYERTDPTGMPYEHQNHEEFPHDLNPNNPKYRPLTMSVQQMETVLNNWGNLTAEEIILKMKNEKDIIVNEAQSCDFEKFKKTIADWTCRRSTRAKYFRHQ